MRCALGAPSGSAGVQDPSLILLVGLPLAVGAIVAVATMIRIQAQLDMVTMRQKHAAKRIESLKSEAITIASEVQKLPSKIRATKEHLVAHARKKAQR